MPDSEKAISRVERNKTDCREYYDRISRYYDLLEFGFESRLAREALDCLEIHPGEVTLEIGFGTGKSISRMAGLTGGQGMTWGIDISREMILKTRQRMPGGPLTGRLGFCQGDALHLPFSAQFFDAVFIAFTLELFDTPEIPLVLREIMRVLKIGGRLGVIGLSRKEERSPAVRVYEWLHGQWPKYIDCRPIYIAEAVENTGFRLQLSKSMRLVVLPVEIIVAVKDI